MNLRLKKKIADRLAELNVTEKADHFADLDFHRHYLGGYDEDWEELFRERQDEFMTIVVLRNIHTGEIGGNYEEDVHAIVASGEGQWL